MIESTMMLQTDDFIVNWEASAAALPLLIMLSEVMLHAKQRMTQISSTSVSSQHQLHFKALPGSTELLRERAGNRQISLCSTI